MFYKETVTYPPPLPVSKLELLPSDSDEPII